MYNIFFSLFVRARSVSLSSFSRFVLTNGRVCRLFDKNGISDFHTI